MRHFGFLRKYWALFIIIIFSGLAASFLEGLGFTVVFPILEGQKGTAAAATPFPFNIFLGFFGRWGLFQRLQIAAVLLIIITAFKCLSLYTNTISSCRLQMVVIKHFRMLCFNQLTRTSMGYFNSQKQADLQTLCNIYTINLGTLVNMLATAIPNVFDILILIGMLFLLSWKMTLIALAIVFLASFVLRIFSTKADSVGRLYNGALKSLNSLILDVITGMKTIRIFRQEKETLNRIEKEVDYFNKSLLETVAVRGAAKPIFESVSVFCLALMMIAGSFLLLRSSETNLPKLLVFIVILYRIVNPVMAINQMRIYIKVDLPAYREVFNFLKMEDKQCLKNGTIQFSGLRKGIELKRVKFRYNLNEPLVFQDASLFIPKGAKVGIVGFSGAGKSTLIELLMRFYDPQSGSILIDGVDLRELDVYSWRKYIGVVSQDAFLFNDTLRSNITFAKPQATQEELELAVRKAHAHDFINTFSKKYDTLIGDRGVLLSGGQRQRIAIARAIITDPEIFIFDEATSSLDSESERIVQEALDEVGRDKTVITIAHRLSTISNSDIIFIINEGRIVEKGTHQKLLEANGVYKKLVQMQELGFDPNFSAPKLIG